MFKQLIAFYLITSAACDWSLSGLANQAGQTVQDVNRANPMTCDRKVTPQQEYETHGSLMNRLWEQFDPFPVLTHFSSGLLVDVKENPDSVEIQVDMPGVNKEDISVKIHKNYELVVSANKRGMTREEGQSFRRVERFSGYVSRTLLLPNSVDLDKLAAEYKSGVLHISVPKIDHSIRSINIK